MSSTSLLAIFSLLDRDDALATSSSSRRTYSLAISRVFANVYWRRDTEVDEEDASESRRPAYRPRAPHDSHDCDPASCLGHAVWVAPGLPLLGIVVTRGECDVREYMVRHVLTASSPRSFAP
ncbi:uncharacterized protein BXZ73DRAFT_104865 [Epithele typhae]|uniref:uncharacterized protein n=1 Tax=Epithele typhae TaxID=378194 RepID=UPI002008B5F2|nr:uncharacterized protein BXZ73DRAFT_104865 [Epithele typhae]KAH9919758.1 hypothetical protein BXZ73DRAFT_104865 [Epithele typhae]